MPGLLNVACSRARGKLVVVAHTAHLLGNLNETSSLAELLNFLLEDGRWMDARAVLTSHDDPDVLAGVEAIRRAGERPPAHGEPTLCKRSSRRRGFLQNRLEPNASLETGGNATETATAT